MSAIINGRNYPQIAIDTTVKEYVSIGQRENAYSIKEEYDHHVSVNIRTNYHVRVYIVALWQEVLHDNT